MDRRTAPVGLAERAELRLADERECLCLHIDKAPGSAPAALRRQLAAIRELYALCLHPDAARPARAEAQGRNLGSVAHVDTRHGHLHAPGASRRRCERDDLGAAAHLQRTPFDAYVTTRTQAIRRGADRGAALQMDGLSGQQDVAAARRASAAGLHERATIQHEVARDLDVNGRGGALDIRREGLDLARQRAVDAVAGRAGAHAEAAAADHDRARAAGRASAHVDHRTLGEAHAAQGSVLQRARVQTGNVDRDLEARGDARELDAATGRLQRGHRGGGTTRHLDRAGHGGEGEALGNAEPRPLEADGGGRIVQEAECGGWCGRQQPRARHSRWPVEVGEDQHVGRAHMERATHIEGRFATEEDPVRVEEKDVSSIDSGAQCPIDLGGAHARDARDHVVDRALCGEGSAPAYGDAEVPEAVKEVALLELPEALLDQVVGEVPVGVLAGQDRALGSERSIQHDVRGRRKGGQKADQGSNHGRHAFS